MYKRYLLLFIVLLGFTFVLSGCATYSYSYTTIDKDPSDDKQDTDYSYFKNLDFSQDMLYIYANYYYRVHDDLRWYEVFTQNQAFFNKIKDLYFDEIVKPDDTAVVFLNGETSYLKLVYNDKTNPVVVKQVTVQYIDITKNSDGTDSNIKPGFYSCFETYHQYEISFDTMDGDYYSIMIIRNTLGDLKGGLMQYYSKYTGPKTYYVDNIPIIKIWKDGLGYRVDIFNSSENKTNFFVYPRDISPHTSEWFLNMDEDAYLKVAEWDYIHYDIKYIHYDEDNDQFILSLRIYSDDNVVNLDKLFTLKDLTKQTYTENYLNYEIELSRVGDEVVNITFISKEENYLISYSLTASD